MLLGRKFGRFAVREESVSWRNFTECNYLCKWKNFRFIMWNVIDSNSLDVSLLMGSKFLHFADVLFHDGKEVEHVLCLKGCLLNNRKDHLLYLYR